MLGRSPPKHRHDGTSPLPLGMDWSPPPKKWDGRDTVWPHDPHTGWSYCVTIPSWIVLPKSRGSDPVVFYRVQVGIQSPEGITTTRGISRRFNDFLKLFAELKREFPKKNLPPTPPKGLLRLKSRTLLEERRCSLEEWMGNLLSDIDISRSTLVATFLELEAAARSSFHDGNQHTIEANSSQNNTVSSFLVRPNSGVSFLSSSLSVTSDYGSDNAYEASELGTPRQGRYNSSEIGTEDLPLDLEVANSIGTFINFGMPSENGLLVGESALDQLEEFSGHKSHTRKGKRAENRDSFNGDSSKVAFLSGGELVSEPEHGKLASHTRKLSAESLESDISSVRGSETFNFGAPNSYGDGTPDFNGGAEARPSAETLGTAMQFPDSVQIVLPLNQRNKMNRVLVTMQQRLTTVKTDMEDLIARLNQEMAVKDYLTTKVKDLEVELESTKQKGKENLQQAILSERERFTQTQWDMEELRRKCLEMESKLKAEQDEKVHTESTKVSAVKEKELLMQELELTREHLQNLQRRHDELEMKSKADIKVLVKEVKSLRSSQSDLKQEVGRLLNEKSELEKALGREKQGRERVETARVKLLHECRILRDRLQECSVNFLAEEEDKFTVDSSSFSDALDLLATSDNRIGLLVAEAQLLAQDDENPVASASKDPNVKGDDLGIKDDLVRKMLTDIFIDNARLRKQFNSVIRCALKTTITPETDDDDNGEEETARKTVLNKFLER